MSIDLEDLKRKAEAATPWQPQHEVRGWCDCAFCRYTTTMTTRKTLALIERLEKAEAEVARLRMRYLGCIGLLGECSPYVEEDEREAIERAMADATEEVEGSTVVRILDRVEFRLP